MTEQWFHTDDFDEPLPDDVSEAVRQFYGEAGDEFAQMLASFLLHQGGGTKGSHPDNPGWVMSRHGDPDDWKGRAERVHVELLDAYAALGEQMARAEKADKSLARIAAVAQWPSER